jgi:hypothetical protein
MRFITSSRLGASEQRRVYIDSTGSINDTNAKYRRSGRPRTLLARGTRIPFAPSHRLRHPRVLREANARSWGAPSWVRFLHRARSIGRVTIEDDGNPFETGEAEAVYVQRHHKWRDASCRPACPVHCFLPASASSRSLSQHGSIELRWLDDLPGPSRHAYVQCSGRVEPHGNFRERRHSRRRRPHDRQRRCGK